MGQVFKVYNHMFFSLADGCDFRHGVMLNVPSNDQRSLVFAELGMLIKDADAHALVLDWKGSSGVKCCPLCLNIVKKGSVLERDPTGSMKPLWTTDVNDFKLNTDRMFRSMQRRLADIALNYPGQLFLTEQNYGYKYNPHSWVQDTGLDVQVIKVVAFDWMHCWA